MMCLEYDPAKRSAARFDANQADKLKIMRDALVSVTCCVDIQEAAAIANKAMIDCDAVVPRRLEQN